MPYSMPYVPNGGGGQSSLVESHLTMSHEDHLMSSNPILLASSNPQNPGVSMGGPTAPTYHQLTNDPQQHSQPQPPPPSAQVVPSSAHYVNAPNPNNGGVIVSPAAPDSSQYYSPYCDSRDAYIISHNIDETTFFKALAIFASLIFSSAVGQTNLTNFN
ncbi:hypothetical protein QR98_0078500 [Sarcoptes scabiei]|uniref:Uncharacterized protein n=1 Tax=Sarcoptes scabiei TaxID=52283 RepID=A0A132AEA0_SARSC|nr:hypothetical protein QR98_0078500 [Sarcoptes scabiei]